MVGGDQLRRAGLALEAFGEQLIPLAAVDPPTSLVEIWADLTSSLAANRVSPDEFTVDRLDVSNTQRAVLIGDVLKRVLASGSALEKARLRLLPEANRAAGGSTL